MFQNNLSLYQNTRLPGSGSAASMYARLYNTAINGFNATLGKGNFARLIRGALQRPQSVYDLNALKPALGLRGSFYSGMQVLPIRSMIASEGRTTDFDMDFHPILGTSRGHWVKLTMAYLAGLQFPSVKLIRVDNASFVRDEHHRNSVSRTFGQLAMDAEVITWKALSPIPWQSARKEVISNEQYL